MIARATTDARRIISMFHFEQVSRKREIKEEREEADQTPDGHPQSMSLLAFFVASVEQRLPSLIT